MNSIRLSLLILVSGLSALVAQPTGIEQDFNFVAPPFGSKFIEWFGKSGRSYFLQASDPSDHLNKWNWAPVIERGNDEWISYEVDSTAEKAFFRLQYTDQTATDLDNADFDGDGLTNLQEITPVIRPGTPAARSIGGGSSTPNSTQTNPLDGDTDHDGLRDKFERDNNLDATDDGSIDPNNGPNGDPDGDGISNLDQQNAENPPPNSSDYSIQSEVRVAFFGGSIVTRPSGEKSGTGAFVGNGPGGHSVYFSLNSVSQLTKNYFVSQLETLPYLSLDDFTLQQQEDLEYPFEVNSFYEEQPFSTGWVAQHSDAGSSYYAGVGQPQTYEGDQSPSTVETLVATSRQTRFRIKAARADHAPFIATYLKVNSRQVGFQQYIYGLQEEITKVEPYIIQIPEGELYSEWHEFKTELLDGYSTNVHLLPVDLEPDANMAGVVGDVVKSAVAGSTIKHFVSPKTSTELTQDYVILKATGITADQITPGHASQVVEWDGGEAMVPADHLKRRVKRNTAAKSEVKIRINGGGAIVQQMNVWVVWATGVPSNRPFTVYQDGGTSSNIIADWDFVWTLQPQAIFSESERPILEGANETPPPNPNKLHIVLNDTLAGGAYQKWDVSRQGRFKVINTHMYTKPQLPAVPGRYYDNQPVAVDVPEDFPSDPIEGNDDTMTDDEYWDPYSSADLGKLKSTDKPSVPMKTTTGENTDTWEERSHFREFVRVEIKGKWYKMSEYIPWRVHAKYEKRYYGNGKYIWYNSGSDQAADNMDFKTTTMRTKFATSFFSIMLACIAVSDDMKKIEIELRASKAEFIARNKSNRDPASLEKICENLLSADVDKAVAALDELKELKDNYLLLVAVRHPVGNVRIRAIQALRETGDRSAVPELVSALVTANEDLLKGGSEAVFRNRQMKSALIATIAKISGVKYEGTDVYGVSETKEFMDKLKRTGFATKDLSPEEAKPDVTDSAKLNPHASPPTKIMPVEGVGPESSFKWWWILVALAGIAAAAFAMCGKNYYRHK